MDILVSIFTYLGCVTGIVGALAVSFVVYFSHPGHSAVNIPHTVAITSAALPRVTPIVQANPIPKAEQKDPPIASTDAAAAPAPRATVTVSAHRRALASSRTQYYRRLVEEERARRWAYQQDPDFEARFLGYAN